MISGRGLFASICVGLVAGTVETVYASMTLVPGMAIDLGANLDNQSPSAISVNGDTAYISMGFAGLKPVNLQTGTAGSAWQQPTFSTDRPYNGIASTPSQVFVANATGIGVFDTNGTFQFQLSPFSGAQVQTGGVANSLAVRGNVLYAGRYSYSAGATGDGRVMAAYNVSSPLVSTAIPTSFTMPTGTDTRYTSIEVLPDQGLATNGAHFIDIANGSVIGGPYEWRDSSGADASKLRPAGEPEVAAALAGDGNDAYAFRAGPTTGGGPIQLYIESLSKVGGVWRHTSGTGNTIDQQYGRIHADAQISLFKSDGTTAVTGVRAIEVVDDLLYVSAQGLTIYDISNPLSPVQLARWDATGTTYDLAVYGNTVAIAVNPASGNHVLQLISVPEPTTLAVLGLGSLALMRRRRSA